MLFRTLEDGVVHLFASVKGLTQRNKMTLTPTEKDERHIVIEVQALPSLSREKEGCWCYPQCLGQERKEVLIGLADSGCRESDRRTRA